MPEDDGACNHLANARVPSVPLTPTSQPSKAVNLASMTGLTIVFCYPRTGAPNEVIPAAWDAIPGARGCTPQACSFRDNLPALKQHGVVNVFGLSTQDTEYQSEVRQRVHLPYDLLSDSNLLFQKALNLPTIEWQGNTLIKRLTLAIEDGKIIKYFYPVFPPDSNVHHVLDWLKSR